MKTLTTLTAIAALLAGISMAGAAENMTGNGQFCLKNKAGVTTCEYASLQACQQVAKPQGASCIANAKSTTGSGSNSSTTMDKK